MEQPITQDEFSHLLATFQRSAFRLETQAAYVLSYEREDFDRFLSGTPEPPPEVDWWRPWLDRITRFTAEGKHISRVRVIDQPPSDYQRWELWATPWHAAVGEQIDYISRSRADEIGLPLDYDWWLLDDQRLIVMRYTGTGEIAGKSLTTDPGTIARHCEWRDLAVRNAYPAGEVAAA